LLLFRYLGPLSDRLQPRTDICNFPAPKAALTTANRACSERSKLSAAMLSSRIRLVRISVSAQLGIQDMINLSWKLEAAALDALREGYGVIVAVDACGRMSDRTESAALMQIRDNGGTVSSVVSIATAFSPDFTKPQGQQMFQIVQTLRLA
jgi:Isochorismatase family